MHRRKRRPEGALVLAAVLLAPAMAQAAPRASAVTVPLDPTLSEQASTIAYVLQTVVRQSPRFDYVDLAEAAQGPDAQARAEKAREARLAFNKAKVAYDELDLEGAQVGFEKAIRLYQETDLSQTMAGLLEAIAMDAATRFFNGDVRAARRGLERLLSLKPNYVFDERTFSPPMRELGEDIRGELRVSSEAPLEVQVRPVPARVYVDGVFVGLSPRELKNLAPTEHYVTVVAPGYALVQEQHRAGAGRIAKITLKPAANGAPLVSGLKALSQGFQTGEPSAAASSLAKWAALDEILVAAVARAPSGDLKVTAARVASDGHVLAVGSEEVGLKDPKAMGALAAFAGGLYASDLPRGPGGAPVATRVSAGPGMGRATWGWIVGGTALAAAAGGTLFALAAQDAATQAKAIPQVRVDDIGSAVSDARGKALLADGLFAASAVGVGVALWLILPSISGGEPGGTAPEDDFFAVTPVPFRDGGGFALTARF